jgi:two-component system LytT family sensor kinase
MTAAALMSQRPSRGHAPSAGSTRSVWITVTALVTLMVIADAWFDPKARTTGGVSWLVPQLLIALEATFVIYASVRLIRAFPVGRGQPLWHLGPYCVLLLAHVVTVLFVELNVAPVFGDLRRTSWSLAATKWDVLVNFVIWTIAGIAIESVRRYRQSRAAAIALQAEYAELAQQRAEAELRALKAELNPQFVDAALQSVSALIPGDTAAAERALADLGDVLREAVSHAGPQQVTLDEELAALPPFIELQRARFGGTLDTTWDVAENARDAYVPHMVLQVLIDSALRHGMARAERPAVRLSVERTLDDELRIEVSARATLPSEALKADGDSALQQLQSRLIHLNGRAVSLDLNTSTERGAVARLTLPYRDDDAPVAETLDASGAEKPVRRGRLRRLASPVLLAAYFGVLAFLTVRMELGLRFASGAPQPLEGALLRGVLGAALHTVLIYFAIKLARENRSWRVHAAAALAFGVAGLAVRYIPALLIGAPYGMPSLKDACLSSGKNWLFSYIIWSALAHAVVYAKRFWSSEADALGMRAQFARAARDRAEAELRALKMELNPHFIGNAIATVASLARSEPTAAQRVLAELRNLLRSAVARVDVQEVTLQDEIRGVEPFLSIERARFGDRVRVRWDIEPEAMAARVPHMILQPLIENAVKHGLAPRQASGNIVIRARHVGERLELSVQDDGVGVRATNGGRSREGIGLSNARARLARLYGDAGALDLLSAPGSGTTVRIVLPWREDTVPLTAGPAS